MTHTQIVRMITTMLVGAVVILTALSCSKELSQDEESLHTITISVDNISRLSESEIFNVSDLTITGEIQDNDWNVLCEMSQTGKLKRLDMSDAAIIGLPECSGGWKDDEIPAYTFEGSKTLEEVILPKTLKSIGENAFAHCRKLRIVQFGYLIDSIATRAFYKSCIQGEFSIPISIKVIGKQAFAETDITKVIINSNIRAAKYSTQYALFGNSVFANCSCLNEVVVEEGCTSLDLGFEHCTNLTTVSLPTTLRTIGYESSGSANHIFKNCSSLEKIELPDYLWFIGAYAFAGTALKEIVIPDAVMYIWKYAFHDCEKLAAVTMSNNITQLEQSCFDGCISLHTIHFPSTLKSIGFRSFSDCEALSEIVWSENISKIERNAFSNCSSLSSISLPINLESLGESSFENCVELTDVTLNNKLIDLKSSTFSGCIHLENIYLGNSLKTIGKNCFYNCPNLSKIEIPITVNSFSDFTFAYSGLKEIKVHWTTPIQINKNTFAGLNLASMILEVPIGSKNSYLNSNVWCNFGDVKELQ